MANTFINAMKQNTSFTHTTNGALAHSTTGSALYDLFARGGAMRQATEKDCIDLFVEAYKEDPVYARKCLFYLGDCRGGQGERRFFRACSRYLIDLDYIGFIWNIHQIPEFRRWDDLIYITYGTKAWASAVNIIKEQLKMDMDSMVRSEKTGISLLGKWMPSENASSQKTIEVARQLRKDLDMTAKQYRKMLSTLRERIKVLERLMSADRWDEIEFDKIPSKAGLIYRNAFAKHDITRERYQKFAKDETTKVNAKTLYPYEVVKKALDASFYDYNDAERLMVNKYWDNLEDYFNDKTFNGIAVCDTSGSMTCGEGARPIDVAISLAMYCAERAKGPFNGHYISFSSRPNLVTIYGQDFVEKVFNIYKSNLIDSTNLEAVFDLILNLAMRGQISAEDMPKNVIVISDMQINAGSYWSENKVLTEMEKIRQHWKMFGFDMPRLVYWNVQASNATILDAGPNVTYVSGCSPVIFESILTGKTGISVMYDKLNSPRYEVIV